MSSQIALKKIPRYCHHNYARDAKLSSEHGRSIEYCFSLKTRCFDLTSAISLLFYIFFSYSKFLEIPLFSIFLFIYLISLLATQNKLRFFDGNRKINFFSRLFFFLLRNPRVVLNHASTIFRCIQYLFNFFYRFIVFPSFHERRVIVFITILHGFSIKRVLVLVLDYLMRSERVITLDGKTLICYK